MAASTLADAAGKLSVYPGEELERVRPKDGLAALSLGSRDWGVLDDRIARRATALQGSSQACIRTASTRLFLGEAAARSAPRGGGIPEGGDQYGLQRLDQ
jgi:hypothetical protein